MSVLVSAQWHGGALDITQTSAHVWGDATILVTGHLARKLNWLEMSPRDHLPGQKQVCQHFLMARSHDAITTASNSDFNWRDERVPTQRDVSIHVAAASATVSKWQLQQHNWNCNEWVLYSFFAIVTAANSYRKWEHSRHRTAWTSLKLCLYT